MLAVLDSINVTSLLVRTVHMRLLDFILYSRRGRPPVNITHICVCVICKQEARGVPSCRGVASEKGSNQNDDILHNF